MVTSGPWPKQVCRRVWCSVVRSHWISIKTRDGFPYPTKYCRQLKDGMTYIWDISICVSWGTSQGENLTVTCWKLKSDFLLPSLRRARESHAEQTYFSIWHHLFRMLLPATMLWVQQAPTSLHAAHGCKMRGQEAAFHSPLKLLPLPNYFLS